MAGAIYLTCISACVTAILALLVADVALDQGNKETVTQWLRRNPTIWWTTAGVGLLIVLAVSVHLFTGNGQGPKQ